MLNIAINGFGRIGRNFLRAFLTDLPNNMRIVAINDVADAKVLHHLLCYDSTYGMLKNNTALVRKDDHYILHINNFDDDADNYTNNATSQIIFYQQSSPKDLPWRAQNIDIVLECSGRFRSYQGARMHIKAGAKQVLISAAPFDVVDASIVIGVNDHLLHKNLPIISGVSCTTQALVPLLHYLDNALGIQSAMMTEIHAVTADQSVLDAAHRDFRRARASGFNIIPTTSSAINAVGQVLPHLAHCIAGQSVRVPTLTVAAIDVNFIFKKSISNSRLQEILQQGAKNISVMDYTNKPLVSSDFVKNIHSLIIDGIQTFSIGTQHKVFAWYDNEWGYVNRMLDMLKILAKQA